jgi:hypothetical protein
MFAHALLALMLAVATDETVAVKKGAKLDVNNFAGDVIVRTWDRDAVRVQAEHSDRESIDIRTTDQAVTIRSRGRMGPPRSTDYTLTIPSWMAINVGGTMADVDIDGAGGDVTVETVRGDVKLRGGSGYVRLQSIQGNITVERARARVEVRTNNDGIRLTDIAGDVTAEAINGGIILERIDSSNVDASTVNGEIAFDGSIRDRGVYRLTTHNGVIDLAVPDRANATINVRTYNGEIRSSLPQPFQDSERHRSTLTLGNGSARIELESFNGAIRLRRPGEPRPQRQDRRRDAPPAPPAPPPPPAPRNPGQ